MEHQREPEHRQEHHHHHRHRHHESYRHTHTFKRQLRDTGTVGPVYAASMAVCVGATASGTALSWTSNLTSDWRTGDLNDIIIDKDQMKWISQFQSLGGMVSCIPTGLLNDYIGRKPTLMVATIPFYIGWASMVYGQHITFLYIGRFFCGVGSGMFNVTCPLYVAEISPVAVRGRTTTSFFVFYGFGMLYANFFGYVLPIKLFIFACAAIPFMFNSMFFFQPKSPVHNIQMGKIQESQEVLRKLRGSRYDLWPEIRTIQLELSRGYYRNHFWDMFKEKAVRKACYMGLSLVALKQLSGVTRSHFYTKEIVSGVEWIDKYWGACITGVAQLLFALIPVLVCDKVGRKFLLFVSFSTMALSAAALGVYYTLKEREVITKEQLATISWAPVVALALYLGGYSVGVASISYSYPVEILPADIRARLNSGFVAFNYFNAFFCTTFYKVVQARFGNDTVFYICGLWASLGALLSVFWYPETKNKTSYEVFAQMEGRDVSHDIKPKRKIVMHNVPTEEKVYEKETFPN